MVQYSMPMYQPPSGFHHHSRFCHQLSFVSRLRTAPLLFVSPLATLKSTLCLTAFTVALPDVMVTPLFAALLFISLVTAVAIPEEVLLGVAWLDDVAGSFFAPVHVRRWVRMSEQYIKLQENGRTCLGGNTLLASLPLFLMQAIEGHRCSSIDQLEWGYIECQIHQHPSSNPVNLTLECSPSWIFSPSSF
jgi:hypothetical protein